MPTLTALVSAETVALRVLYTDTPGAVPDTVLATVLAGGGETDKDFVAGGDRPVSVPIGAAPDGRRLALFAVSADGQTSPLSGVVVAGALAGALALGGQTLTYSGDPITYAP